MNPAWLSLRMSAGARPNSLFRSASEYSCILSARLSRSSGFPCRRGLLGRLALPGFLVPSGIQAGLEHFHQIDHVAGATGGSRFFRKGHFLAFHLALDRSLHPGAMLVNVFIRVEALGRQLFDQL